MAQHAIEIILMRQLANCLAMPVFLVDPGGRLLFYNESAEALLGVRYDEAGEMPVERWSTLFTPTDEHGEPLPAESLPLVQALNTCRPAHGRLWILGLDHVRRSIEVTAFPLVGLAGRLLAGVAFFWESPA